MKNKAVACLLAVCASCALALAGCAREPEALSAEEAYLRFVGRWVNLDYPGTLITSFPGTLARMQVTVIRPDYIGENWLHATSASADGQWSIKVKKTWLDRKGNAYCQFYGTPSQLDGKQRPFPALMRVDRRAKVWELCIKPLNPTDRPSEASAVYPERIDPDLQWYYVYYRE